MAAAARAAAGEGGHVRSSFSAFPPRTGERERKLARQKSLLLFSLLQLVSKE